MRPYATASVAVLAAIWLTAAPSLAADNTASPANQPAQAQPQPKIAPQSAREPAKDGSSDSGTTATTNDMSTVRAMTFSDALDAVRGDDKTATRLANMSAVSHLNVIDVTKLDGASRKKLDQAVADNRSKVSRLRAVLDTPALKAKLDARSVKPSRVVAAAIENDGSVTIFVD